MTTNFNEFALNPALHASLQSMKFETPTPIQALAIPLALEGRDILGSAQTGTGKTGAFCVPMINFLMENPAAHALVMLPTRELASQVHTVARQMIGDFVKGPQGIKTALLIGGEPIGKQYAQLDRRPRLIVGTPGRINDHLRGNPDLVDRVSFVVLDEADRMLDMGFTPQIDSILSETALERQTLMFSATFPDNIVKFSKQYLQNPERVSVGVQSKPGENIEQESLNVPQEQKYDELMLQLQKREGSVIIFVRTQHGADKLAVKLNRDEHASEAIHGGLRQRQRDKVIRMFRKGEVRVLVATDVAARGLDVPHIEHVINYDLPQVAEDYVHRIGRTARAGAKGQAVSFISPGEKHLWRDIERMLNPDAANSDKREGGYGKKKFGGGKKFGGERSYGPKKEGGFKARKPFGRADRKDRKANGWNPDTGFEKSSEAHTEGAFDSRPQRREWNNDRPQRSEGYQGNRDGGFKKPFKKRDDDFASDPDSYKRTNSGERKEGGFKKSFGKKPFRSEGGFEKRGWNGEDRSKGFKKPFRRDDRAEGGEGRSFEKPFKRDDNRFEGKRDGGFKKPYRGGEEGGNRFEGRGDRKEGGFKKPFKRDEGRAERTGEGRPLRKNGEGKSFKKPFSRGGQKPQGERGAFRKDGERRSEGHAGRSRKRA
jgi:superfamily II DNA/RNA helicase